MIKFKENFSLRKLSSYKIGGPARYYFEAENERQVEEALKEAKNRKIPVFILGGGTNILFNDKGFNGLVLRPSIQFIKYQKGELEVGAGTKISDLVDFVIKKGLTGFEWAGGLPGALGGAIRGNAGCFGREIKDLVKYVKSVDVKTIKEKVRNNEKCEFGYRSSIFKEKNGEIIISAVLTLAPGDKKEILKATEEKIDFRKERHPLEYPNIGSIFKNVPLNKIKKTHHSKFRRVVKNDPFPVVPVAHLLSEVGLKGVTCGGAMISPKHPNFIVNVLEASSKDVKNLISLAKSEVKKKYGVSLEEEVLIA